MKKIFVLLFLFVVLLSVSFILGSQAAEAQTPTKCIYYFYGSTCPHCLKVKPVLEELEKKYPNLEIKRYEVYGSKENAQLMQDFFEYYKVPQDERGVPFVFVGDKHIVGDAPIIDTLEDYIKSPDEIKCISPDIVQSKQKSEDTSKSSSTKSHNKSLSLSAIVGAAVVDSINPCAIAVLLILLSSLFFLKDRKVALRAGLAFVIAVYVSYFLFGLGLLTFIKGAGLSYWLYRIIGVLAIIIGLWNVKDYFWHKTGPNIEIPKSFRPTVKKLLRGVTSVIGAFLIGFIVTAFELPCTGGPYIFALGLIAKTPTLQTVMVLLLYNFFFVLPLLVILGLVYFGLASIEKAKKWQEENIEKLHLVAGIIMLILGAIVLLRLI